MADKHFDVGDVLPTQNYGNFEVVAVQEQDLGDGKEPRVSYIVRHQETMNNERADAAREEEERQLAYNAAQAKEDEDRARDSAEEARAEHAALNERRTDEDPQAPGVGETVNNDRVRVPTADQQVPGANHQPTE